MGDAALLATTGYTSIQDISAYMKIVCLTRMSFGTSVSGACQESVNGHEKKFKVTASQFPHNTDWTFICDVFMFFCMSLPLLLSFLSLLHNSVHSAYFSTSTVQLYFCSSLLMSFKAKLVWFINPSRRPLKAVHKY